MKTKSETIKDFNQQKMIPTTGLDDTATTPGDSLQTDGDKIKEKAEQKPKTAKELAEEQKQLEEEQKKQQADTIRQLTEQMQFVTDQVNNRVNPIKDWIAAQPTPGGIASLVIFILFMAFVAIPVNDQKQTRLYLFYQSLLGRTHLKYREDTYPGQGSSSNAPPPGNQGGGSGAGQGPDFGNLTPIDLTHLNLFGGNGL